MTVGGLPARRLTGSADEGCQAIGGSDLTQIVLPVVAGTNGWISLDACLAGPQIEPADAAFAAILASVSVVGDAPSS